MPQPEPKPEAKESGRPGYSEGREAILDAATTVIARDGIRGLTYRAVATEARVTHGLVSYHFRSRENLISEAVARAARAAIRDSHLALTADRIEDFASGHSRLSDEAPDDQVIQYELALQARRDPKMGPAVRELYEEYFRVVTTALERLGIDSSPALARLIFAALDGLILQQLVFERPDETDAAIEALHDVLRLLAN